MKFGKYTATKKLGRGAMGEVYYGVHPNLDIPIAIKTLSRKLVTDESYVERFIREAKMAAKIKHENAVMIYDADCEGDTYYIVMEYVAGGDLKDRMKSVGKMPEKEALETVKAVASALKAASAYDIIHRDIKPANIIISKEGIPKLADLGIAKRISDETETTVTGAIIGTPNYLAPEQAKDSTNVDARTDIYSLGCTLFHMLSGEAPYPGDNPLSVLMKHTNDPIPEINNSDVSQQTRLLCRKMLAKSPDDRHRSAEELIEEINKILYRQKPEIEISKRKVWVTGGLVAAVIILALLIAFMPENGSVSSASRGKGSSIKPPKPNAAVTNVNDAANEAEKAEEHTEKAEPQAADREAINYNVNDEKNFTPGLGINMIYNNPGSFQMGRQIDEHRGEAEETLHRVSLTEGFYLSRHEVSVKAWKQFIKETSYKTGPEKEGGAAYYDKRGVWNAFVRNKNWRTVGLTDIDAITTVTRADCLKFCNWLTSREIRAKRLPVNWEFTLPTEAQWEYACRAGSSSTYANDMSLEEQGFYRDNSALKVHIPGRKKPNAWGYFDMHGNVWEFCLDRSKGQSWFDVKTGNYRDGIIDPVSTEGNRVVFRGGSYVDAAHLCRAASRGHCEDNYASNNHGFRLCLRKKP